MESLRQVNTKSRAYWGLLLALAVSQGALARTNPGSSGQWIDPEAMKKARPSTPVPAPAPVAAPAPTPAAPAAAPESVSTPVPGQIVAPADLSAPAPVAPAQVAPAPVQAARPVKPVAPLKKPPVMAKIDSVQLPAWVERGGAKAGVKPGWAIYPGDRLTTGSKGRIQLVLADDAQLKLGEDADLRFSQVNEILADKTSNETFVRVNKGAFNFIAPVAPRPGRPAMVIGIGDQLGFTVLGGQVWGKSDSRQNLLVLIEGAVEVAGPLPLRMDEPDSYMVQPIGESPQPSAPAPREKLAVWLAQTEFDSGRPTLRYNGDWSVSLKAGKNKSVDLAGLACQLQDQGYPTEIVPVVNNGVAAERLMIRRFASRNDAQRFVKTAGKLGAPNTWVVIGDSEKENPKAP